MSEEKGLLAALADLRAHCNKEVARLNQQGTSTSCFKTTNDWLKRLDVVWKAMDTRPVAVEALREALTGVRHWVASLTVTDMNDIVADGGITAGMVVGQEAIEQLRRLDAALTAQAHPAGDDVRALAVAAQEVEGVLQGVREYCEGLPVSIVKDEDVNRLCIHAENEAGYNCTRVDLADLVAALCKLNLVDREPAGLVDAADEAHRIGVRNAEDDEHPACSRRIGLAIQKSILALATYPRPDDAQAQSGARSRDKFGNSANGAFEAACLGVAAHPVPASDAGEALSFGLEGLGEKLFNLSARLKASGFLDDAANRPAYEAVVSAFAALSTTGTSQDQGERA